MTRQVYPSLVFWVRLGLLGALVVAAVTVRAGRLEELQEAIRLSPRNPSNYYNLGLFYLNKGLPGKALPQLEKSAKYEKDKNLLKETRFLVEHCRGLVAYKQKDYKKAIGGFEKARKLNPGDKDTHKFLAYSYFNAKKPKEAEASVLAFQKAGGSDAGMEYLLGIIAERYRKSHKKAVSHYEKALEINPNDDRAREAAARGLVLIERFKLALIHLEKMIDKDPNSPLANKYMGLCHHHLGDREKGISYYLKADKLKPGDKELLYNLALLYKDSGEYQTAMETLDRHKKVAPGDPRAQALRTDVMVGGIKSLMDLASSLSLEGDFQGAKKAYREVLNLEGDHTEARNSVRQIDQKIKDEVQKLVKLGSSRLSQGDTAGALLAWNQGLDLDPNNKKIKKLQKEIKARKQEKIDAFLKAGDYQLRQGNYKAAQAQYEKVFTVDKKNAKARAKIKEVKGQQIRDLESLLAVAQRLERGKKYDEAIQVYQQLSRQYPKRTDLQNKAFQIRKTRDAEVSRLNRSARTALKAGKKKDAVAKYNQALRLDPSNGIAKAGIRAAGTSQKVAVVKKQEDVQQLYLQGVGLYTQDKFQAALNIWEKASKKNPNDQRVKQAIKRVKNKLDMLRGA